MTRVSQGADGPTQYDPKTDYGTRQYEREKQYITFGSLRGVLYRRADVANSSWFLRIHVTEEQRHYRKSLQTADRKEAVKRAQDLIVDVLTRVKSGQKLLALSFKDVALEFDKHQRELATSGQLAERTVVMQRYRVNLGSEFLEEVLPAGLDTKISAIDGAIFNDYLPWRKRKAQEHGRTLRSDVVRDELLVIRKLFFFARDKRLCPESAIPSWRFAVEKVGPKRRRITAQDFDRFMSLTASWVMLADAKVPQDLYNRLLLKHFVQVIANTGLRSGELFNVRNRDVEIRMGNGECAITVLPEYSKVRKGRDIVVVGARRNKYQSEDNPVIRWCESYQRHKKPSDYLFATREDGSVSARDVYYHTYKKLRRYLKENNGPDWFDTYHCRHHWITNRLLAEEPIHLVAKAAGTSTSQIENTYSHVLTSLTTRRFGRKQVVHLADGSYKIVTRDAKPEGEERRLLRGFHDSVTGKT